MQKENSIKAVIFDMDGTLYSFDDSNESQFTSSRFGQKIRANCVRFFEERLGLSPKKAEIVYEDLKTRYNGEVSLAVEKEFGIDRGEYFAFTWNLEATEFVKSTGNIPTLLSELTIQSGVLTAAPRVWAERVLQFLQIRDLIGDALFTGDPDLRKPNPEAFMQLANFWGLNPEQIISIGDQEQSDILPAKAVGMKTVRIAKQAESAADFIAPNVVTAIQLLKKEGVL